MTKTNKQTSKTKELNLCQLHRVCFGTAANWLKT